MSSKKQLFFNIIFILAVLAFTVYKLSKETDLRTSFNQALHINIYYLLIAIILVLIFVLSESVIIRMLLKKIGKPHNFFDCSLYSFIGFLYSCLTPSASGGQPAQMVYMKKRGILIAESMPILMIVTIAYKGVLVLVGAFIMFINISDIKMYLSGFGIYIYFGLVANVVVMAFMILLLIRPQILYKFCKIIYNGFLGKLLGKRRFRLREKTISYLDKYISTAIYYRGRLTHMAFPVFGITILQRFAYFAITVAVYLAFGNSGESLFVIIILSACISVAVDMLPLPGGMGATEVLFISIFEEIFGQNKVVTALLVNRFLTFYLLIILGIIANVIANFRFRKRI